MRAPLSGRKLFTQARTHFAVESFNFIIVYSGCAFNWILRFSFQMKMKQTEKKN